LHVAHDDTSLRDEEAPGTARIERRYLIGTNSAWWKRGHPWGSPRWRSDKAVERRIGLSRNATDASAVCWHLPGPRCGACRQR